MLRETTTLGVRMQRMARRVLPRSTERVQTPYGEIAVKVARGADYEKRKSEYEDAARAARACGARLMDVQRAALRVEKE